MIFTVYFSSQLREHLRALRKQRGLTQAELGRLLGVGQARIAEIERDPGVVSVEQLMKLLSMLHASLLVRDDEGVEEAEAGLQEKAAMPPSSRAQPRPRIKAGSSEGDTWRLRTLDGGRVSTLDGRSEEKFSTGAQVLRDAAPGKEALSPSRRNFVIRAKKGSW